jgi:hypothetical protein
MMNLKPPSLVSKSCQQCPYLRSWDPLMAQQLHHSYHRA